MERSTVNVRLGTTILSHVTGQPLETFAIWRYMPWILVLLGVIRGVVTLLAYPPAHGADSGEYFLYAERLAGFDLPHLAELVPPLYPYLILLTFKALGSVYWLIALQFLMGVSIAPIYYLAIKRFNPILALFVGLVVASDTQTAILFNFTSTEPLYAFLLALTTYVLLSVADQQRTSSVRRLWPQFLLIGLLIALLFLTRPVAKFLIAPMVVVLWIVVRDWYPPLIALGGFCVTLVAYALISLLVVGQIEGFTSGFYMLFNRVAADDSTRTAEVVADVVGDCTQDARRCIYEGEEVNSVALIIKTFLDFIRVDLPTYLARVLKHTSDFLALSGQQYGYDPELPSTVQCDYARTVIIDRAWLQNLRYEWVMPDPEDNEYVENMQRVMPAIFDAMCPPVSNIPTLRQIVDAIAFRYRSLGRPQPYLWYGILFLLVLIIHPARRYLPLVLIIGTLLLYHALASAVIFNVQPRYVVVTNPFRASLLGTLVFLIVGGGLQMPTRIMAHVRSFLAQR